MSSKRSISAGGLGNTRPTSAKGTSRTSTSKGKLSSRSNISNAESEFSDLSVTGSQKKVAKKTEHHRTDVRSSLLRRSSSDAAGSDSDRTTSSSGAKSKTYLNHEGNTRYSEGKSSSGKSRTKHKRDLAMAFKNKPPAQDPPNKQGVDTSKDDIDDWWPGSNHVPKVPPLHDLTSPSEEKNYNWWDQINVDQPNFETAQNLWPKATQESDPLVDAINDMLNSPVQEEVRNGSKVLEEEAKESPVPKLSFGNLMEDESILAKQNAAAVMIQKWYRGWSVRRKTGRSAVKHLLDQKRLYKERQSFDYLGSMESKDAEKARRREEKARLARQAAIKELQNKREEKRLENQRKAEEELVFLQSSGVISKKKSNTKQKPKTTGTKKNNNNNQSGLNNNSGATASGNKEKENNRPTTGSSTARKLDEMFQDTRASQVVKSTTDDTPETDRTESTLQNVKSEGTSKSTFDDLLESLKQLEQQPDTSNPLAVDGASKYDGWVGQLTTRLDDASKQYLSAENLDHLSKRKIETEAGAALSAEKLQTIMNFLDEVEKAEEVALSEIHQSREEAISRGLTSPSANIDETKQKERDEARAELARKEVAALESMSANAADVTNAMMALKIELEEKKRTNELLQRALNQQRDFTLRQGKESEKDSKQRLAIQKQEYEATIQRHLTFIDQLIDDKKILGERCEELLNKMKTVDKKYTDKIKTLEDNHAVEIKKQKEVIIAAEKLRREKWIAEKTQQIKEVTVKGLEPDIQKLIAKHKAEFKKLRSAHQAELLEADERAGRRYIQQIEELREQLEREKENACTKERGLAQQRLEKQMEQEEQAYQQQRRRLYSELQDEKERMAAQAQRQRQEMDETMTELQESHKTALADMQRSHEKAMADIVNKHQFEIKDLKEKLEIEKQAWIENYMKKQDAILLTKERELKEGVREARDREIEMVITRLEEETAASREECERAAENRIKRIRNKYESEMKELEKSESNTQQKCNSLKEQLLEVEGEVARLRSQNKQIVHQKEDVDKVLSKLQEERGKVADIIRQEFADRLVTTEEDNKRLKNEVSEMRARHRLEMDRITREKEQEMEQLHQRVKQAIARKDETVKALQEQQQAAMKRADHLEMLLQQQRKKLLP